MKKALVLILVFALTFTLSACGAETTPDTNEGKTPTQSENNIDKTKPTQGNSNGADKTEKNEISFEELTVVDNKECSIKITKIDTKNIWGYTLKAQLENKSASKTYMFSVERAAINGVECDPLFATEVAATKKSNNDISFSDPIFDENDIGQYTDIELAFRVYDSDDWNADPVAEETVHIYPYGEDKATKFERSAQASDNVILDNEYAKVIVTGYEKDEIWGYTVNLFLLNKTDKSLMFSVDNASVNGFMADPFYAAEVSAGKCAFSSMAWSDTTLEENDIKDVKEIEFELRVYDSDNWLGDDFAKETITLKP